MRYAAWPGSVASLDLGPDFESCPGLKDFDQKTPKEQEGIREFYRELLELNGEPKPLTQRLLGVRGETFSRGKERF